MNSCYHLIFPAGFHHVIQGLVVMDGDLNGRDAHEAPMQDETSLTRPCC